MSSRRLKEEFSALLAQEDLGPALEKMAGLDPKVLINPLFHFLLSTDPLTKWHAVSAFGLTVQRLANQDLEGARVIMRRLLWQLNDESGGIGWGCPEAMGESVALHRPLAEEYSPLLISFIMAEGNFLEHRPLQRGALWAVGRLASAHPDLAIGGAPHLMRFLNSRDPEARGLAAWTLGLIEATEALPLLHRLLNDETPMEIYRDFRLQSLRVKDLALEAMASIGKGQ